MRGQHWLTVIGGSMGGVEARSTMGRRAHLELGFPRGTIRQAVGRRVKELVAIGVRRWMIVCTHAGERLGLVDQVFLSRFTCNEYAVTVRSVDVGDDF